MGIYEKIMMEDDDDEVLCSACNKKVFWVTKSCCIYSCYNHVCSKCRYCEEHCSLRKIDFIINDIREYSSTEYDSKIIKFMKREIISLEDAHKHMESNIENGFRAMQQVHGKRLPYDVSRLITSFLY